MARTYGAKTDQHRFPVVTNMTGAFSIGAWVRRTSDTTFDTIYCRVTSGGVITFALEIAEVDTLEFETSGAKNSTATVVAADGWVFIGVDKAAGSVTPRCHIWKQASGWTHQNFSGSLANPGTATGGTVRIGEYTGNTEDNFSGDIEVVVEYNGTQLTDAQWESVAFSRHAMLAARPTGLWELRQASVEQKVGDLSGTGMNESVRAGTSVATRSCPFYFAGGPPRLSQTTSTGKLLTLELTDSVAIADELSKGVGKAETEAVGISDVLTKAASRPLADAVGISDAIAKKTGRPLVDQVEVSDAIAKSTGKSAADQVTIADAVAKATGKSLTDQVDITDSIAKKVGRSIADALAIADSLARRVGKAIADALGISDLLETTSPTKVPLEDLPTGLILASAADMTLREPVELELDAPVTSLELAEPKGDPGLREPAELDIAGPDASLSLRVSDAEVKLDG